MTGNDANLSATPSNWPNNPNRPVENISWEDVQNILQRINEHQAGRLPHPDGSISCQPRLSAGICLSGRY